MLIKTNPRALSQFDVGVFRKAPDGSSATCIIDHVAVLYCPGTGMSENVVTGCVHVQRYFRKPSCRHKTGKCKSTVVSKMNINVSVRWPIWDIHFLRWAGLGRPIVMRA